MHTHAATKRNRPPSVSTPSPVAGLLGNDPPLLAQPQPPPKTLETGRDVGVGSEEEGVINGAAAFALERGRGPEESSSETGRDSSDLMKIDTNSGGEGVLNGAAEFSQGRGGDAKEPSPAGQDSSVLRQMSVLVVVAGLAAVVFDYEHGMAGFYWFRNWVRMSSKQRGMLIGFEIGHEMSRSLAFFVLFRTWFQDFSTNGRLPLVLILS